MLKSRSLALVVLLLSSWVMGCGNTETGESASVGVPEIEKETQVEDPAIEMEYWQSVKDSSDVDQLLSYIKKYPQGRFIELAEARLKNLSSEGPNVAGPGASKVDPPPAEVVLPKKKTPSPKERDHGVEEASTPLRSGSGFGRGGPIPWQVQRFKTSHLSGYSES